MGEAFAFSIYKHVGSIQNDSCFYGQEVVARLLSSRLAKKEIAALTNSRLLCIEYKVHMSRTFCTSRLCVGVAFIPCWTTEALILCSESYNSLLKVALLSRNDEGKVEQASNVQLFSKQVIPNGQIHLGSTRLRYLCRIFLMPLRF